MKKIKVGIFGLGRGKAFFESLMYCNAEIVAICDEIEDPHNLGAVIRCAECAGAHGVIDEQRVLDTLGLAGNLETAKLMGQVARRDTAAALEAYALMQPGDALVRFINNAGQTQSPLFGDLEFA